MIDWQSLPPDVLSKITLEGIKQGYLPAPDGYDSDGSPLWSLDLLCRFFDQTKEEALETIREVDATRNGSSLVDPTTVHRIH